MRRVQGEPLTAIRGASSDAGAVRPWSARPLRNSQPFCEQRVALMRRLLAGLFLSLALLATLLNPYGPGLWHFLAETVRLDRPDITDWKPLLQLPPSILVIESILPLVAIAALISDRREHAPARDLLVLALLSAVTIRIGRVDAFLQAGIVEGAQLKFTIDNETYECNAEAPILPQSDRGQIWVYRDRKYKPSGTWTKNNPNSRAPDEFFTAASDSMQWWLQ